MLQPMIFHMTFGLEKSSYKILMEDFSKPKVVYPETTLGASFALDSNAYFIDKTGFILISENAEYLQKNIIL